MQGPGGSVRQPSSLSDGTVTLRGIREDDLAAEVALARDPAMRRFTQVPLDYGEPEARAFARRLSQGWERGTEFGFVIERDGAFAGSVSLRPSGPGAADVGFALTPAARGRSTMSRALRLVLLWGFDVAQLQVVHWRAHLGNWPSRRAAWAVGFAVEGSVRGLLSHRGEPVDAWIGSLRRGDPLRPAGIWLETPSLTGGGVRLRPLHDGDAGRIVEACTDPVTRHWLAALPRPYTLASARAHLEDAREQHASGRAVVWAVGDVSDDRLVGEIAVHLAGYRDTQGEIGYWAHPDARGRGLTTAATRLAARHALLPAADGGLGLDRVVIKAAAGNDASQRVALRAGFVPAGTERRADRLPDGTLVDHVRFDLTPDGLPPAADDGDPW